jgi:hypothetical protein
MANITFGKVTQTRKSSIHNCGVVPVFHCSICGSEFEERWEAMECLHKCRESLSIFIADVCRELLASFINRMETHD